MTLVPGQKLAHYEVVEAIRLRQGDGGQVGKGGPASARGVNAVRELWRGLAVAKPRDPT